MQNKTRPIGIIIFILWAGIMGFFIAWDGLTYFMKGADVTGQPEFWIADLRKYILPGILWDRRRAGLHGFRDRVMVRKWKRRGSSDCIPVPPW